MYQLAILDWDGISEKIVGENSSSICLRLGAKRLFKTIYMCGMKNVIVNATPEDIAYKLRTAGVLDYIHEIDRTNNRATAIRETLEQYNLKPHRAFYLANTFDNIQEARKTGVVTIGIVTECQSKARVQAAKPDYLIHALYEIKGIIKEA